MVMFDLDHFKRVNQQFGHRTGDDVLSHVGRRLAQAIEASDFCARLGGDEFALILSAAGDDPAAVVDRLRTSICQDTRHAKTTASAGWAVAKSTDSVDLDQLFRQADLALRQAKASGRDRTSPSHDFRAPS
jgi:diguanylate cyclase (GGDEF)-like protein